MHPRSTPPASHRGFAHFVALIFAGFALATAGFAAAETKNPFNIPEAAAAVSLMVFSEQSGHGVIFSTDAVKGVKTNAVHGELPAREALARLVARTGLAAKFDEPSGEIGRAHV